MSFILKRTVWYVKTLYNLKIGFCLITVGFLLTFIEGLIIRANSNTKKES